ncbi:NAD(P)-dependent alcohol dehydrogenase [Ignatzschineria ureiclastica]|uniref:NAD(P)-dependent alcohol dehydrogenase n=2 Tax=Ignatzschineria ureiclastica TaxID=472582 RepID=A0A2U2AEP2_9GAMM|nr:NAD(P)-dependent alcohol dehydrogenase [Ignatzschineria ureiclastica]
MQCWVLHQGATGLTDLTLEIVSIPEPKKGEVRVKMEAYSINYRDIVIMQGAKGLALTRDIIPLSDGAGVIDAVGEGVEVWQVGDRVVTQLYPNWKEGTITSTIGQGLGSNDLDGTLAEYVILSVNNIIRAPQTLSVEEASTLACAGITAWSGIYGNRPYHMPLKSHEKVLVLGTGGVAMWAIAIALSAGAEVYCTTSQPDKIAILEQMGVKAVFNYREDPRWGDAVYQQTGGVDLVVNTAGTASMAQSINALALGGRMSMIGAMENSQEIENMLLMIQKNITIFGVLTGSEMAYQDYIQFIDEHNVKPMIEKIYDFTEAKEAYRHIMAGRVFGKIVIKRS